jgi:hypothetical protein
MKRAFLALLLAIQVIGAGAITLAHARDLVVAPAGVESGHDGRCAILHDELRCALCHYASARVVVQNTLLPVPAPTVRLQFTPVQPRVAFLSASRHTAPARAPPLFLS